ncbi:MULTISPECIES: chemotaxis protein CheX [unclassified Actinotalea]|uniref:chemotaxis protein CheX n=1 Tax=unclassified Actinotalea TaxID=2638618 RepID=UPI0015F551A4|nr:MULTISPECIES: chemotaxis protein CheX [unclassified Actinotalea]
MTAADLGLVGDADPVLAIAEEVFAAMVDGEPGGVRPWAGDAPALEHGIHAWVDVHGTHASRVLLSTEEETAALLTRALLAMGPAESVADEDLVDALGEVANVVGGNVKALVADPRALGLPVVDRVRPAASGDLLHLLNLEWRGRPLEVALWTLT